MSTEILLISDLHLSPDQPATVERFLHFTRERARQARDLYILGDLFDAWIGDDNDADPYAEIRNALSELAQSGTAVYLQHGNRDFLLGEVFCTQTGCTLIADEAVRDFFGKPDRLSHGNPVAAPYTEHDKRAP